MAKNDYIDFNLNDLPESFQYTFDDTNYNLLLYYNDLTDNFYIDLNDDNNVPIVKGEKLVYHQPLWGSINDPRIPMVQLVPIDDDENESTVSKLNFPEIIKLQFLNRDNGNDDT